MKNRIIGAGLTISENLRVKHQGHHMTKYGQKWSLRARTPFQTGAMLRISENLRVKGQGISHEGIWAKLEN